MRPRKPPVCPESGLAPSDWDLEGTLREGSCADQNTTEPIMRAGWDDPSRRNKSMKQRSKSSKQPSQRRGPKSSQLAASRTRARQNSNVSHRNLTKVPNSAWANVPAGEPETPKRANRRNASAVRSERQTSWRKNAPAKAQPASQTRRASKGTPAGRKGSSAKKSPRKSLASR
jgi:hypothetical protein